MYLGITGMMNMRLSTKTLQFQWRFCKRFPETMSLYFKIPACNGQSIDNDTKCFICLVVFSIDNSMKQSNCIKE